MNSAEYQNTQNQILLFGRLVRDLPLKEFIEAADRADVIGPFLDPTLWMKGRDNLATVTGLARALLRFQNAVHEAMAGDAPPPLSSTSESL